MNQCSNPDRYGNLGALATKVIRLRSWRGVIFVVITLCAVSCRSNNSNSALVGDWHAKVHPGWVLHFLPSGKGNIGNGTVAQKFSWSADGQQLGMTIYDEEGNGQKFDFGYSFGQGGRLTFTAPLFDSRDWSR